VADDEEIWGLRLHDGWLSMGADDQRRCPVGARPYATA